MAVEQERTHNGLHAEDTILVKGSAIVGLGCVLDFGAVADWCVLVQGVMGFLGLE